MSVTIGRRTAVLLAAGATVAAGLVAGTAPASAHVAKAPHWKVTKTVASGYVGPLQFAVSGRKIYVADSFTANLYQVGRPAPLVHNPDPSGASEEESADIAGVGVDPATGVVAFTETNADHSYTRLALRYPNGKVKVLANLAAYEKAVNPDRVNEYGIHNPSKCVQDAFAKIGAPANYTGQVDSHPYAVVALGGGAWAVADAGGNDIVKVDKWGHVSTLGVLPPAAVKITKAIAGSNGLPACAVGLTYKFEPVPTDVERGPYHTLVVTSLASGPGADPTAVPTGRLWLLGRHHNFVLLSRHFANATNAAYDGHGNFFVAELGTGNITQVWAHHKAVVANVPGLVGIEYAHGHLYASTAPAVVGGNGPGEILKLSRTS